MKPRLFTGVVLGASLLGGQASAAPVIGHFEAHDDMNGGALWRNDQPNNNNQRGAGAEHQSVVQLKGGRILMVATASYTDVVPMVPGAGLSSAEAGVLPPSDGNPGVQATGRRVQALCTAYQLDPQQGLVKVNMSYFTNNNSPDWQNGHKTTLAVVNGGEAALAMYGYDPNGVRTRIYGRVLGPNCELMSQQTQLFADPNNNDDYGGVSAAFQPVFSDVNGVTRIGGCHIGNGNGNDDGHCFAVSTQATGQAGAAAYTIKPEFNIVTEGQEERTRPFSLSTPFPDMMLACWSKGNNRPTDSVRCGMINTAPGVPDAQRLVWRQYVIERTGNIHYTTPAVAAVVDAQGKPTDTYILSYVKVDTTNRQGRAKGRTSIQTVPIQISMTGLKMLDTPKEGLFGLSDGAHPAVTTAFYGPDKRPVAFMFSGSITDGGTATAKIIGMTPEGKLEPVRALNWAAATSGGFTSQWYGHNPNSPQGRTSPPQTILVDNPGYGITGGYQSDVKSFLLVSHVYHKDHGGVCTPDPNKGTNNGTCGGKNALGLSLIPLVADAPKGNPTNPNDPSPTDPTTSDLDEPGTLLGGCSAGGNGAGAMLLLGFAAMFLRRRRSN
jgi:MYXO-CTERM domain-containing protein